MQSYEGLVVVERVLSQLAGGCIFSARQENGERLRVKFAGRDIRPLPGDWLVVVGRLTSHRDRFGRNITQIDSGQMKSAEAKGALLKPWLERLPNIGATRAGRLVDAFGHDLPQVLGDVSYLSDVADALEPSKPVLAAKIAAQLYARVAIQAGADAISTAEVEFLAFLERLGIRDSSCASQLWRLMASVDAVERLRRNPYIVAGLVDWKMADRVGQRLLREVNPTADVVTHPARLFGALNSVWRDILAEGNTAATVERVESFLEARGVLATLVLHMAGQKGALRYAGSLLRAPGAAWLEDQVVIALQRIENQQATITIPCSDAMTGLIYEAESSVGMHLTDEQRITVVKVLSLPVVALQGGAGVGKTTVMKVLALAWERLGGNVALGALAGKAALTLARGASTHDHPRLAYTVARLIGMLERQQAQEECQEYKCPAGDLTFTPKTLLIIDEASMLDTPSLHKLLSLLPEGVRLLLSGDRGQLPPVGIGNFFHDLVAEGTRVVSLTKVLRQASDSVIPQVAAQVREGITPSLAMWSGESKGVYLVPPSEVLAMQRQLRGERELMVVAAMRATVAGINEAEASFRRSSTTETRRLGPLATIAVNDPVVMTTNRYQDGLFNGLLGVVTAISGSRVAILWDGESRPRQLPAEAEGNVELAYAITCHKAQGSSAEVVLIAVEYSILVTREWLYTAVTRGKELVLLAGTDESIARAVQRRTERLTGMELSARLNATTVAPV